MKSPRLPLCCSFLCRASGTYGPASDPRLVNKALSGKDNFEKDFEKSHIKTNLFQKILLGLGSGFVSITSPSRGDMIAVMGEVTGYQALEYMRTKMNESKEGRKILEDKPRISSGSLNLEKFKSFPDGTLGKAYSNFLRKYGYTPDTRNSVQFVDDLELAYIAQRYRETHDLIHTLLDMPTNMLGEVTVKWVEAIQFKLPMCATGALFGAVRLAPKFTRAYSTKPIIKLDSWLIEKIESKAISPKKHPGIMDLSRIELPPDIFDTIKTILRDKGDLAELVKEAKAFKIFFKNRVLPIEVDEKVRLYKEHYNRLMDRLPEDAEITEAVEDRIKNIVLKRLHSIVNQWRAIDFNKKSVYVYLCARAPAEFAVLKRVFNEIYKRDKEFAPKTLMDFGSGVGTVNWAAHEYWGGTLVEYYCVDSSKYMNELAAMILRRNSLNNEPFIKNVYYRQYFPATPRLFDIVVSAYTFFELPDREQRMRMLTALWNDTNEYLVLIENGNNWGFKIITEVRDYLLAKSKEFEIDCHIFAPCPHDLDCPRLFAEGKKTPCSFHIKYKTLSFSPSNDDTGEELFCYLIARKRPAPKENERPCRIVRKVSRSKKLACCKLCTTEGALLDSFVTASKHGKPAYLCARASNWGDLIPGTLQPRMIDATSHPLISSEEDRKLISVSDSNSNSDFSSELNLDFNENYIENDDNYKTGNDSHNDKK